MSVVFSIVWSAIGGIRGVLAVIVALGLAFPAFRYWNTHFDNPAIVRAATAKIKAEMVSKAELAAAKATAEGWKRIAASQAKLLFEARARARKAEGNAAELQSALEQYNAENANLQDQIDEMLSKPIDNACVVDGNLLGRLRGR